jgi:formiminotetrahydrofolate cyclodeaminase
MEASIWTGSLAGLLEKTAGTEPVPAGVAISAVTASLALALLAKVLAIAARKRKFAAERVQLEELLHAARAESSRLTSLADEDIEAFHKYLESRHQATRKAIEIPMEAARAGVRGLGLCADAAFIIRGLTAGDVGSAAALLAGAVRAMLVTVDFNLREMAAGEDFSAAMKTERNQLGAEVARHADAIVSALFGSTHAGGVPA